MDGDYYNVLGLTKYCTKKEIFDSYLDELRESPEPERRGQLDRALLVLRISYLRYVYDKRGEAGLREERCVETLERGMTALAHVRSRRYTSRRRRQNVVASSTSSNAESSSSSSSSSASTSSTSSGEIKSERELTPVPESHVDNVSSWLDHAWRNGKHQPQASSTLRSTVRVISSRDKKDTRANVELSSSFPSSIHATDVGNSGKHCDRHEFDNFKCTSRHFFSQRRHENSNNHNINTCSHHYCEPHKSSSFRQRQQPRPILGARHSQRVRYEKERRAESSRSYYNVTSCSSSSVHHPYSHRENDSLSSSDSRHLYHMHRPLLHSSTGTTRVLIQK